MDEQETVLPIMEGMEVQSDTGEILVDTDADLGMSVSDMEQTEDSLETDQGDILASALDSPDAGTNTSNTLDAERVAQIVDAVLQSDRVEGLFQSVEYTLQLVTDTVSATSEKEKPIDKEPMLVVSADDLLDRLEARQVETTQAASAANTPIQSTMVARSVPVLEAGGEIAVPEGGEIAVLIQIVEALKSYFEEDDNSLLTTIRDNTASIKQSVEEIKVSVEPHSLMDTPFEEYTVIEGLLLVLVLWLLVLHPCIRMIKGGFSWLLS